jgi:hypothetical protein
MESECGICMETYDKYARVPKVLSCGHTFCEECLIELMATNTSIVCPNCRTITKHINEVKNLPSNQRCIKNKKEIENKTQQEGPQPNHENIQQSCKN